MVLKHRQERRLITYICDVVVVQVVQSTHKLSWSTECADQLRHVVRNEVLILPYTALERLASVVLKRADRAGVCVDVGAFERVLVAPGAVEVSVGC
jgi:hypothetical protein